MQEDQDRRFKEARSSKEFKNKPKKPNSCEREELESHNLSLVNVNKNSANIDKKLNFGKIKKSKRGAQEKVNLDDKNIFRKVNKIRNSFKK